MEVGSEVYSMALSLQLQKIVSSPLAQELRLSSAATNAAALDAMIPRTSWFSDGKDWNMSTDVITNFRTHNIIISNPPISPFRFVLSFQSLMFGDYPGITSSNGSDSVYSHANSSLPLPSSVSSSSSSASSIQDIELYYRHSTTMNVLYCVAYCIVFIVGLVGNSFVISVVLRLPRMRTVTNYFIVNLAIADILVIIFCVPATLLSNIFVRK